MDHTPWQWGLMQLETQASSPQSWGEEPRGTGLGLGARSQGAAGSARLGVSVHGAGLLTSACPTLQMRPPWR